MSRRYGSGAEAVTALDAVSLRMPAGSFTAVMGPSGSGKSTLLQCAAGLDRPDSGTVRVAGTELTGLRERRRTLLRRDRIGFVFQAYNLLPTLTAEQNVALPLRLAGRGPGRDRVREALARVGLEGRAGHRPGQLSGGQQQRVALARALVTRPAVLFCDEPTGALDTRSGREVLRMVRESVDLWGQTVVMVTHDPVAASFADRVVFLVDGRVDGELPAPTPAEIARHMTSLEAGARAGAEAVEVGAEAGGERTVGRRSGEAVDGQRTVGRRPGEAVDGQRTVGPTSGSAAGGAPRRRRPEDAGAGLAGPRPDIPPALRVPVATPALRAPGATPALRAPGATPALRVPGATPALRVPSTTPAPRVPGGTPC